MDLLKEWLGGFLLAIFSSEPIEPLFIQLMKYYYNGKFNIHFIRLSN
jgi:hypothetical protein